MAQILHEKFGVSASARASLGIYNTKEDIDILSVFKNIQLMKPEELDLHTFKTFIHSTKATYINLKR